jgi:ABC-type phosphate transport system substrate-binding protein
MRIVSSLLIIHLALFAKDYALIVNKNSSIESLTQLQVKSIFLKKNIIINDQEMVPINLLATDELREYFESEVLNMSRASLQSFWVKEHYMGKRPPLNMQSYKSVIAFVKKIDGAIGYIPLSDADDELKIVYRWSK